MGFAKDLSRRRGAAFVLAFGMLLGTVLTFQIPAAANHPDGSCLDVEPETDENPTGTTHTVTATLRSEETSNPLTPECPDIDPDQNDATNTEPATASTLINFEITGPNDPDNGASFNTPDRQCTIPAGGTSCAMPGYVGLRNGVDTIRGWIAPHAPDEDEPVDSTDEEAPGPLGGDEPDETDVVEKTWESATAGARATTLDCEPETDSNPSGDPHTVTCTARNQHGGFTEGTEVDAEATGANDPDNANGGSPDFSCRTNADGRCSFTHGPGGTGATNNLGTTTYRAWIDDDGQPDNQEGDLTETRAQDDADDTDTVEKTWTASPLECTPETDLNPAGTDHTITCTARDTSGNLAAGQRIHVEATGANDPGADGNTPTSPDFQCTTASNGQCSFTHGPGGSPARSTNTAGTTTYRAWQDTNNDPANFEGDAAEGRDEIAQQGQVQEPDRTDVVEKTWGASRINCDPETDRNVSGTSHQITCQATDENNAGVVGAQIDVEAVGANDPDGSESFQTPDFSCTTSTSGGATFCQIIHGPGGTGTTNDSGTTVYSAWIDLDNSNATAEVDPDEGRSEGLDPGEPDNTDVVEKTWIASRLDCSPESDTNPAQSAHTITCTATDNSGQPSAGILIDVEATGPNDPDGNAALTSPDFSCTTGSNGSCSFTHGPGGRGTTTAFGRTLYRAWVDADGNDATPEADATEGRDETAGQPSPSPTTTASPTGSPSPTPSPSPTGTASPSPSPTGSPAPSGPGTTREPDSTDVVEKNWSAVPTRLTVDPATDSAPVGSCNPFTVTTFDASNNPVANVIVDVEQRHANSDTAPAGDEPTVSFCTPTASDGSNPSSVDPSRGDLGNGTDGTLGGEAERATDSTGKVTFGIRVAQTSGSDGTGNVLVTVFYENEDNDDADSGDPQDTATKTWTPSQARTIDCEPEGASNRLGTEHTVTCTVRNQDGQPVRDESVTFTEDGPGEFTGETRQDSDANGQVSATTTSNEAGTQTITGTLTSSTEAEPDTDECERAAGDPTGAPAGQCSDSVEKEWLRGRTVASGPCRGFSEGSRTDRTGGGQVIVGTPDDDELTGTSENDVICGLGGNDSIRGRGGNDRIVGNAGRDRIQGDGGRDRIHGGAKNDILSGERGSDRISGGGGNDILRGLAGSDTLGGNGGDDVLRGGGGRDDLSGGAGNDAVNGGAGRDSCAGGPGQDTVRNCE